MGCGTGVAVGSGIAVGRGTGVAVGSGVAVGDGVGVGSGMSVGSVVGNDCWFAEPFSFGPFEHALRIAPKLAITKARRVRGR